MILVSGAGGYIGSRVARQLASHGAIACVRDFRKAPGGVPVRIADYDQIESPIKALGRVETLVFIPSDGFAEDLLRHATNVVEAAKFARTPRMVFLSIVDVGQDSTFYYSGAYREIEDLLMSSGSRYSIARCGLYSDFVSSSFVEPSRASGVLSVPAGDAPVRLISRDEVARQLVHLTLSDGEPPVVTLERQGPITFSELSAANGLAYEDCDPAEYLDRITGVMEKPWPEAYSSLFASIRQGRFA